LHALGTENYGLYNVIAGAVTIFNFLGTSMSGASQRYLAFDLGKENKEGLFQTFGMCWLVQLFMAFICLILNPNK
jgi:O-antigen/teichoic acid export membrane protein